jgi:putative redox protein
MEANVIWKQRMSFEGTAESGFKVPLGTSPSVGGEEDGFRPLELIAIGIAGCTSMDVVSILKKKHQELDSFEVKISAELATEHPKVFTSLRIEYFLSGTDISQEAVERAVQLSAEKYCPAQAMFQEIVPIEMKINILN